MKDRSTWNVAEGRTYQLMGATRGPDNQLPWLNGIKNIVTARVRSIPFTEEECGGVWVDEPMTDLDLRQIKNYVRDIGPRQEWDRSVSHFMMHLQDAIVASQTHPVWGGLADDLWRVLEGEVA